MGIEKRKADSQGAVEIAPGVFWVGKNGESDSIECNPYLVIDGEEGALIDPGSVLDFEAVIGNVRSIIPLERISLIVAHHQDPDLCSSIPSFFRAGLSAPIALHWRTSTLVKYYGTENPFYIVNEKSWEWRFASGRVLRFMPAPYCHFAGSIMTWDERTKTLFSGDLFGAFTSSPGLYAGKGYSEAMKAFHEHYMPSREILMPVMDSIIGMDIARIAPQHGKVIAENVRSFVEMLRELRCGTYLGSVVSGNPETPGAVDIAEDNVLSRVFARLAGIVPPEDVMRVFEGSSFTLAAEEPRLESIGIEARGGAVEAFVERLLAAGKSRWYTILEPYLLGLLGEYGLPAPKRAVWPLPVQAAMPEKKAETEQTVLHDRATGLYNAKVFRQYLETLLRNPDPEPYGLMYFSVDNLEKINSLYGRKAGDDAIRSLVYILKNAAENNPSWTFFKLDFPYIACIAERTTREESKAMAERCRTDAADAEYAAEKIKISAGILCFDGKGSQFEADTVELAERLLLARLFSARKSSSGGICDYLKEDDVNLYLKKKILLVEPDDSYVRFLEPFFTARGWYLLTARDGSEVGNFRDAETPDLIIAEAMAPRVNGFELRERMLATSRGRNIPYILVSRRKDEEFIRRASEAGILWFLKKPFSKTELLGLIDNLLRQVP